MELRAPATSQTVYEIGSISKQFAADAILLLVEDGKRRLDDPLSKYIDETPAAWSAITLRHVLTHTAGLADFDTGNIGFSYRREYTPREFIDLLAKQPLQFAPGEHWNDTNAFPLLGIVVERTSGQSYAAFVQARIFKPLGLESARFKTAGEVVPHRADGYLFKEGTFRHGETLRPAVIAPNGGVPEQRNQVLNTLHANILDVFNEHSVQIMSPNYEADPGAPKVVPKDRWYEAPARREGR